MTAGQSIRQQGSACTAGGAHPARILFPVVDGAALRNVASSALLRLPDGSVRFLRLTAATWTEARLDAVARRLQFVDGGRPPAAMLKGLSHDLGDASFALVNVVLDSVDAGAWDLRRAALASVARALARPGAATTPGQAREQAEVLERRWQSELQCALAAFVAGLDTEACAAARACGPLDSDVYNFLVRAPQPAWRRQFVRTFPVLVPVAVSGPPESLGAFLRDAVDAGRPLVRSLAARWSVSESAVRVLVDKPATLVGARWQRTPHHLVRILDAVRPEDRPGDERRTWQRFNDAVTAAEEIFRRPAQCCPLTLGWIRQAGRRRFHVLDGPAALTPEVVAAIDRLRAALAAHASRRVHDAVGPELAAPRTATLADHLLATLPAPRLAAIARRFVAEQAARRATLEDEARLTGGMTFWPLLPETLVSADGRIAVVPLATLSALRDEGAAQSLCIGDGTELIDLAGACLRGEAYMVSLRDGVSGERRSTAELRPTRRLGVAAPVLRVHQHKAFANGRPSPACTLALREALDWANGTQGERHRARGLAAARARAGGAGEMRHGPAEEAAHAALAPALGPALLRRLDDELRLAGSLGVPVRDPPCAPSPAAQYTSGHDGRTRA